MQRNHNIGTKMKVENAKPAKSSKAVSSNNTVVYIPVHHIALSKLLTYRKVDEEHVDSLMEDIRRNGLLQPLVVFTEAEDKKFKIEGEVLPARYLAAGLHRRAAILKLRKQHTADYDKAFPNGIPCTLRVVDPSEAMLIQLRENVQRREMSPEEIFPVLEKLAVEPYNLTGREIAKKIGKTAAWVSQMMAVNDELDEDTRKDVVDGKIDTGDARRLAAEVRKDRKSGKTVEKEDIHAKAAVLKDKKAMKDASGKSRATGDDRKVSAGKVLLRYKSMSRVSQARKLEILEETLRYLGGELARLPAELREDPAPKKE